MQIVKITHDGLFSTAQIDGSLAAMQAIVGGFIEAVDFTAAGAEATIWLNEEGKITGLETNQLATHLANGFIFPGDYIAGDVFISGGTGPEGETLGLTNEQVDALMDTFVKIGPEVLNL